MKKALLLALMILPLMATAQIADSTYRVVPMQAAYNFRDAGGYKTTDNREVVSRRIYRSAEISRLTDQDLQEFSDRKIQTVIDFRGTVEAAAAPDRLPEGVRYTLCPAGSENVSHNPADYLKGMDEGAFLMSFYEGSIPYLSDRYKPLFKELLELPDDNALLFHCTGGRDRTGMANALILYILNVPMETIIEDYVASNHYLKPMNKEMYKKAAEYGVDPEEIEKKFELRPEYMQGFFNSITQKYGTVENFFAQELGVGETERTCLRNKFTQDCR